jgi:cephalosporin hydroxylase
MPQVRDEIIRRLWRGNDPFQPNITGHGMLDMQGWGSQHPYLTNSIESLLPSVIVEVGVWKGGSAIHMASRLRDLAIDGVVIAVDTWLGAWDHWIQDKWFNELRLLEPTDSIFATFLRNVRSTNLEQYIIPLPLDSINASRVLNHFHIVPDIVHIDAGHDYAAVLADLEHWWPLLRPGGLLIGDDYRAGNDWPDVKRAFDDYFRALGLIPIENANDKCRLFKPKTDSRTDNLLLKTTVTESVVLRWREKCRIEMSALIDDESIGIEERLRRYVHFSGPNWEPGRVRLMDRIAQELTTSNQRFGRGDIFGADGAIKKEVVQAVLPDFTAHYPRAAAAVDYERFELLPELPNLFACLALPVAINKNMGRAHAPPLAVYRVGPSSLFLTPLGYQLFWANGTYCPAASTRSYPHEAMECPHLTVNKCVVIVQDVFEGTNYSHFLFDWIPRLGHFLNSGLVDSSCCTFVMGGAPSEFHCHIIRVMCEIYSLKEEQIVFPEFPQIWRIEAPIYFFSDLKETMLHPAQMANKRSIAIIREVCAQIRTASSSVKRIYISRGDTPLRRIENEAALVQELRS